MGVTNAAACQPWARSGRRGSPRPDMTSLPQYWGSGFRCGLLSRLGQLPDLLCTLIAHPPQCTPTLVGRDITFLTSNAGAPGSCHDTDRGRRVACLGRCGRLPPPAPCTSPSASLASLACHLCRQAGRPQLWEGRPGVHCLSSLSSPLLQCPTPAHHLPGDPDLSHPEALTSTQQVLHRLPRIFNSLFTSPFCLLPPE